MATLKPSQLPRARDLLTKGLFAALLPVFAPLIGAQITGQIIASLARSTLPQVQQHRQRFIALANAQYQSMDSTGNIAAPPLRTYTAESWAAALERAWKTTLDEQAVLTRDDVGKALVTADHQGRDAERSQLIAYSMHDDEIAGWARVDFSPPTCPFCTMLISRGPVYTTAESAGGREKFHHGDTCTVILVTEANRDSYPGIEHTRAAEALYRRASRGSRSSAETVKNLRKLVREQETGPVAAAAGRTVQGAQK